MTRAGTAATVWRTLGDVVLLSFHTLAAGAFADGMPWYQAWLGAGFIVFPLAFLGVPFAAFSFLSQAVADRYSARLPARWRAAVPTLRLTLLALSVTGSAFLLGVTTLGDASALSPARVAGGLLVATLWMLAIRGLLLRTARLVLDGRRGASPWRSPTVRTVTADVLIGGMVILCTATISAVTGDAGEADGDVLMQTLLIATMSGITAATAAVIYAPCSLVRQALLHAMYAVRAPRVAQTPNERSPDGQPADEHHRIADVVVSRTIMCLVPALLIPPAPRAPASLAALFAAALAVSTAWSVVARRRRWALR